MRTLSVTITNPLDESAELTWAVRTYARADGSAPLVAELSRGHLARPVAAPRALVVACLTEIARQIAASDDGA